MSVIQSKKLKLLLRDLLASKQLANALDPAYDGNDASRPKVTHQGKTYKVITRNHFLAKP